MSYAKLYFCHGCKRNYMAFHKDAAEVHTNCGWESCNAPMDFAAIPLMIFDINKNKKLSWSEGYEKTKQNYLEAAID